MYKITFLAMLVGCLYIQGTRVAKAQSRYAADERGTYRETTQRIRRPVSELHYEDRQQTFYCEKVSTHTRETQRSYYFLTTEYHWEPRWHGVWNPFRQATLAYHWIPRTRWELRSETVQVPVTTRQLVPEQRTVRVPVSTLRIVEEERVTRVPVQLSPGQRVNGGQTSTIRQDTTSLAVGGISRMENDPPRLGIQPRMAGVTLRR